MMVGFDFRQSFFSVGYKFPHDKGGFPHTSPPRDGLGQGHRRGRPARARGQARVTGMTPYVPDMEGIFKMLSEPYKWDICYIHGVLSGNIQHYSRPDLGFGSSSGLYCCI